MPIRLTMIILFIYSLVPLELSSKYFDVRLLGLPISYIPFMVIYFNLFVSQILRYKQKIVLSSSLKWLISWLILALISFAHNILNKDDFSAFSFFADFSLIVFYGSACYFGLFLYLIKSSAESIEELIRVMVKYMTLIVIFGSIRYIIFDSQSALFFNILNPLKYRLSEVLLLTFITPLAMAGYIHKKDIVSLFYVCVLMFGILVVGSRTSYIAMSLLIPLMLYYRYFSLVGVLKFMFLAACLLGATALFDHEVMVNLDRLDMVKQYLNLNFEAAIEADQVVRRIGMILGTKEMIYNNPILGVGLGKENYFSSFPSYYLEYFHVGRPHNQYLSLGASTGMLGLFVFIMFLLSITKLGYRTARLPSPSPTCHYVNFLLFANILVLVLMIGYEFQTQPIIWIMWAIINSYFYVVKKA